MKIAILGAMPEEIEPLLKKLDTKEIHYANNTFYLANYANHELVIAYSKIGKVNSALSAAVMIEKFGAQSLLFSGVAGALNENFKIGDLLYATQVVQHDLDISAFGHPLGFVPGGKIFIQTDQRLNDLAKQAAQNLNLSIHPAIIASGDQFICDDNIKNHIKTTFNADAVEMEGASVAVVCDALNVPFFMLRAVSDEAGKKAEFDFDEFMIKSAQISADFTLKIVDLM